MKRMPLFISILALWCSACQVTPVFHTPGQAREHAEYLRARSAGLQKRARAIQHTIAKLHERVSECQRHLDYCVDKIGEKQDRIAELRQRKEDAPKPKQKTLDSMLASLTREKEALLIQRSNHISVVGELEQDIVKQRQRYDSTVAEAEELRRQAAQIEKRARTLSQKQN